MSPAGALSVLICEAALVGRSYMAHQVLHGNDSDREMAQGSCGISKVDQLLLICWFISRGLTASLQNTAVWLDRVVLMRV